MLHIQQHDGGRAEAGYKGSTGDCVTRAISIASGKPYQTVYDELAILSKAYMEKKRKRRRGVSSPRLGVHKEVYHAYLLSQGFKWHPVMGIGTGCSMTLSGWIVNAYFKKGSYILSLSKHLTAIVDGIVLDNHDPSREGTRCIYGYYSKD